MARSPAPSLEDLQWLRKQASSAIAPKRLAERCRIVLLSAEGKNHEQIATVLGISRQKASRWRARFVESGRTGLENDAPGRGRKAVFRMPHGTNDTVIAARARAFADAAVALKAKFLALEHPADFIEALRQRVVDFENADSDQNTGLQDQVGATASIDDLIDQGLVILKQLDAIMHNKYAGNPEKLTASNIQRPSPNAKKAGSAPTPVLQPAGAA